jgi:hypothetical protein
MINSDVIAGAGRWRAAFEGAQPFKHVCIDNFFLPGIAERLLKEFPKFDQERALNEFGVATGKHVVTEMAAVSPLYAETYEFLRGKQFLTFMSDVTGVKDLLFDDTMFGGGTHDNIDGQSLAPHVDFNYDQRTGWHRRLNALLYLNPVWEESWGGCIELHRNPRQPESDSSVAYAPLMNRMVIFETNEYSWHGFRKINLPPSMKGESRKCLSIYLYTKTRPAEETVASHGTFYVQPPLPERFRAGYVVNEEDVAELKAAFRIRDTWIEAYQKGTIRAAADAARQKDALDQAFSNQLVRLKADQGQVPGTVGVFHDGWLAPHVELRFASKTPVGALRLIGKNFEGCTLESLCVESDAAKRTQCTFSTEEDGYLVNLPQPVSGQFAVALDFSRKAPERPTGDLRPLCFNLYGLELVGE